MIEQDYINATNLAKLRIAEDTLRSVLPQGKQEILHAKTAMAAVAWLRGKYEQKVA